MKRFYFIVEFIVALCFALLALVGCGVDDERKSILKVYNWADYIDEDLLSEFEEWYFEQTGEEVEVVYQLFDINEIMLAKIERGKEDFVVPRSISSSVCCAMTCCYPSIRILALLPTIWAMCHPISTMSSVR